MTDSEGAISNMLARARGPLLVAAATIRATVLARGLSRDLGGSCRHRKYRVLIGDHVKSVAEV